MTSLRTEFPESTGHLEFLYLDLANLSTIRPAVHTFLSKETRLDVLVNNAAIMVPPAESKSAQGYDLQTATNVYGPFLLSILLHPILAATAEAAETGTVRIVWAASHAADLFGPIGGVHFVPDTVAGHEAGGMMIKEDFRGGPSYAQSKAADIMLGVECAKRWDGEGMLSFSHGVLNRNGVEADELK
jgi:retinol dehydrogenase-12